MCTAHGSGNLDLAWKPSWECPLCSKLKPTYCGGRLATYEKFSMASLIKNRQLSSAKAPNDHCWWCVTKTICLEKSALGNYVGSANWIFSPSPFLIHS